jgi:cysteine desulfurase
LGLRPDPRYNTIGKQNPMSERVYLDFNATAPLRPQARAAMAAALDVVGNPSSIHAEGRAARRLIELARAQVAALAGGEPRNVRFTSGGTEANGLALAAWAQAGGPACDRLLVSAVEHPSVLAGGAFEAAAIETIPVDPFGRVDLDLLAGRLQALATAGLRPLLSLMMANNETGVIQPVAEAARLVHQAGGLIHVDAVQAPGRIPIDLGALEADLLTLSGHKIGAATGVGALIKRSGDLQLARPPIRGGGQEFGTRAGTENVAGIAGFGAAAAAVMTESPGMAGQLAALRARLEQGLIERTPGAVIFGAEVARLPNTTLLALAGMKAETAVIAFDLAGLAVSSGAACSSGKVQPSHVLAAMGVPPALARGAIRVSLGPTSSEFDVERFLAAWIRVSGALGKGSEVIAA